MKSILFLLTLCIFYAYALMGENVRVAEEVEFPFVVAIKTINRTNRRPETDFINTGIVVANTLVLTTVYGIQTRNVRTLEVLYNTIDLRHGARRRVRWFLSFNEWADHHHMPAQPQIDMGVLKLYDQINVAPVAISQAPRTDLYRLNAVTAGWGKNEQGNIPRILQAVRLRTMRKNRCRDQIQGMINRNTTLHRRYLCTIANPTAFIREGDNGGPLLHDGELIAMNKGMCPPNDDDLNPQRVNLHIAIDDHRNFINDIIANW